MEIRRIVSSASSAFVDSVAAAAEELVAKARAEAQVEARRAKTETARLQKEVEQARHALEAEKKRAQSLEADLDTTLEAHREVTAACQEAEAALVQARAAQQAAEAARERLQSERDAADRTRERLQSERDAAEAARQEATAEREAADRTRERLQLERDAAETARQQATAERDAAERTRERLQSERDAAEAARQRLTAERDAAEAARREAADARARSEQELADGRALVERARQEVARLTAALEEEAARSALAAEALSQAEDLADRIRAEDAQALEQARLAHQSEIASWAARLQAQVDEAEQLRAEAARAQQEAHTLRAEVAALREETEALRSSAHAAGADGEAARGEVVELRAQVEALQTRLQQASADAASAARELDRLAHEQREAARDAEGRLHYAQQSAAALLPAALRSLEALAAATTIDDLLATITAELQAQLPRVAIFRVKGNHLEGHLGAGLDESVDIHKLVIPLGVDSLVARAITSGTVVRAGAEDLAVAPPPVRGAAAAALAAPILFEGEPYAVVYGDSSGEITETKAQSVLLLARHATLVLARMSQEMRILREMRAYAVTLVHEAQEMFDADTAAGRPLDERRQRLHTSIDCARELYAHRAALESSAAGDFLEQHLGAIAGQRSPFGEAIAALLQDAATSQQRSAG